MNREQRKAAIAAYREQKTIAGVYAVRCAATGECWVGQWSNLETVQNRIWFSLRMGSHTDKALQAAWNAHGADQFSFEVLEVLPENVHVSLQTGRLKERAADWQTRLDARPI